MSDISLVAIDLAKETFQVLGVNRSGKTLVNRKVWREQLMEQVLSFQPRAVVAMEACGTAHYWGRRFQSAGYEVKLIAPQYVKPFVMRQKNDSNDAAGIAAAASRASMRFVAVKTIEQQDIQSLHRVRERYVKSRTALMNELRGLLMEYGVVIPQGRAALQERVATALETESVTETMKSLARELYTELGEIEERLRRLTKQIEAIAAKNESCQRLMSIPGIGEITASALYAAVGQMQFKNGRELAAFLGLVPRQNSTGGKERLGRITKHGDTYVRKLLVHGARSVLQNAHRHTDRYSSWAKAMRDRKGYTKGAVAVANRNARIAWAVMSSGTLFRHDFVPTWQSMH